MTQSLSYTRAGHKLSFSATGNFGSGNGEPPSIGQSHNSDIALNWEHLTGNSWKSVSVVFDSSSVYILTLPYFAIIVKTKKRELTADEMIVEKNGETIIT